jgi:hypothetical protein
MIAYRPTIQTSHTRPAPGKIAMTTPTTDRETVQDQEPLPWISRRRRAAMRRTPV